MEYSPSKGIQVQVKEEEVETGTFTGDGTADRVVDIGFTPKAIWIYPEKITLLGPESAYPSVGVEGGHHASSDPGSGWSLDTEKFQGIVENGFKTGTNEDGEGSNAVNIVYFWMAIP